MSARNGVDRATSQGVLPTALRCEQAAIPRVSGRSRAMRVDPHYALQAGGPQFEPATAHRMKVLHIAQMQAGAGSRLKSWKGH